MKRLTFLFYLFIIAWSVAAIEPPEEKLMALSRQASSSKTAEAYIKICEYFNKNEIIDNRFALYLDSTYHAAMKEKSVYYLGQYYSYLAEYEYWQNALSLYYPHKKKALQLFSVLHNERMITACCSDLGYYFNQTMNYDSARHYMKIGLNTVGRLKGDDADELLLTLLTNMASSYLFEGVNDSALIYTEKAKEHSCLKQDTFMLIENYNQLGVIYRRMGRIDKSALSYEKALNLCEAQQDFRKVAYIYGNLSTLYAESSRLDEALPFSRKAVRYALKTNDQNMIGYTYSNLGALLVRVHQFAESALCLREAIHLFTETGNGRLLGDGYSYMIKLFAKTNKLDSLQVYQKRYDELASTFSGLELMRYYQSKSSVLSVLGQHAEALTIYKKLEEMQQRAPSTYPAYELYRGFAVSYQGVNDFQNAYQYLNKAYLLRDSLLANEKTKQLSEFMVKYQTQEKELEITRLRQEQLEQEAQALKIRIRFIIVLSLLLILLLLLLYKRQRQKVKAAELAHYANEKEREFLSLQNDMEQRLTRKYIDGLESERERLAKELHDGVCNSLLALEMNLKQLSFAASGELHAPLALLTETRQSVRTVSHDLMPPAFQYATINEMLLDYTLHLTVPSDLKIQYRSTEHVAWAVVPSEIAYELYRIVQESVNNALKYAAASVIDVALLLQESGLSVIVSDNGNGFDTSKKFKGIGLRTIRERAKSIGANLTLQSDEGKGSCLTVTVKLIIQ